MDTIYSLFEQWGLFDAWRVGYPLLIGVGALTAWTALKLAFETDPKLRFFFPSWSDGVLLTLDLIVSVAVALLCALALFRPTTPMAALSAGFTWTAALELVCRPKRSHAERIRDKERHTVEVPVEE